MRTCSKPERAVSERVDALGLVLDIEPGLLFSASDPLADLRFIGSCESMQQMRLPVRACNK